MMDGPVEATEPGRWGTVVPKEETSVHVSHGHLSNSLDSLTVAFNDLEGRLGPVLKGAVDDDSILKGVKMTEASSPVRDFTERMTDTVDTLRHRVEFLIRSLDI
jgi:hypothetical protein